MNRLNLCKLCGAWRASTSLSPPRATGFTSWNVAPRTVTTPSSATPWKKPLASGTLLTPIGTVTCRPDNETVTSFCLARPSVSCSNGSPRSRLSKPLTPYGRYSARTSRPTTLYPIRSMRTCRDRSARIPASFRHGFYPDTDPVFSVFHPAERLNMIPSSAPPFFQIHKSHGIGYGMKLSRHGGHQKARSHLCGFVVAGAKRDLSGSGGLCPFSGNDPQPIRSINTVSVPPLFRR